MGPETVGGLAALGLIGGVTCFLAWLNKGGCKLGRHEWEKWQPGDLKAGIAQERRCKACGFLQQQKGGCALGDHQWTPWESPEDSQGIFQQRSCTICKKVEQQGQSKDCKRGVHDWGPWSQPVNTGLVWTESKKKIYRQDRYCRVCNEQDSKTINRY